MLMKLLGWLIGIILVIWLISNPARAGVTVHNIVTGLITFATTAGSG